MKTRLLSALLCFAVQVHLAEAQANTNQGPQDTKSSGATCSMCNTMPNEQARTDDINERGALGMGFSQTATTHHFFLTPQGGAIQVEANSSTDKTDREEIRLHLSHIARAFEAGNFEIPMFVHAVTPPGVPAMKLLKERITYLFVETPNGGRVEIRTADGEALQAVHEFLQFQIRDHKTGDPLDVPK